MSSAAYHPAPWHGVSLDTLFRQLTEVEGQSAFAARALITDLLGAEDTVTTPPLPRPREVAPLTDGGIAIITPNGTIPGTKVFVRQRSPGETRHQPDDEAGLQDAPANAMPAPVPSSEASASNEQRAIDWLRTKLDVRGNTLKFVVAQRACSRYFGVSKTGFGKRVWSQARTKAKLDPVAPRGRKRKSPPPR